MTFVRVGWVGVVVAVAGCQCQPAGSALAVLAPLDGTTLTMSGDSSSEPGFQTRVTVEATPARGGARLSLTAAADAAAPVKYARQLTYAGAQQVAFDDVTLPAGQGGKVMLTVELTEASGEQTVRVITVQLGADGAQLDWAMPAASAERWCATADASESSSGYQHTVSVAAHGLADGSRVSLLADGKRLGSAPVADGRATLEVTLPLGASTLLATATSPSGTAVSASPRDVIVDAVGPHLVALECGPAHVAGGTFGLAEDLDPATADVFDADCAVTFDDDSAEGQPVELRSSQPAAGTVVGTGLVSGHAATVRVHLAGGLALVAHHLTASSSDACGNASTAAQALDMVVDLRPARGLQVSVEGEGQVDSIAPDAQISCGAACSGTWPHGSLLELAAQPRAHWQFAGWSGCTSASGARCEVQLDGDVAVHAAFAPITFTLTVANAGGGSTDVDGSACQGASCQLTFQEGSTVTLVAHPQPHLQFMGWQGACAGQGATCALQISESVVTAAVFAPILHAVTVAVSGAGAVLGFGQSCAGSCDYVAQDGDTVTFTAAPAAHQRFIGWGGACSGSAPTCQVAVDAAKAVTAQFAPIVHALGVAVSGVGSVAISGGAVCSGACSSQLDEGSGVDLTATPAAHQRFVGWSGACSGSAPTCRVSIDAATSVSATFAQITWALSVSISGTGSVSATPGSSCSSGTCAMTENEGDVVTLTAAPGPHQHFVAWSGACSGVSLTCEVTLAAAANVTAMFGQIQHDLSVTVTGSGTVSASPGSACSSGTCVMPENEGDTVALTATPAAHQQLSGWSGACSGLGPCSVDVDAAKSVAAVFVPITHTVTVSVSGSGSVGVSGGAACTSGSCGYPRDEASTVTLTAAAGGGAQFSSWSGACAGQGATCTVTVTADLSATASFTASGVSLTVSPPTHGTVSSLTAGINCGATCTASYPPGTAVRLVAQPESAAYLVGAWVGCDSSSGATCDVTLNAGKTVSVTFDLAPTTWVNACTQSGAAFYFTSPTDDDTTGAIAIPFAFNFHGTAYNDIYMTTNGIASFGGGTWEYSNEGLPTVAAPTDSIFAMWDDLYTTGPDSMCSAVIGSPGARKFVLTWQHMRFYGSEDATSLTFSVVLSEGSNAVHLVYYDLSSPQSNRGLGSDATIGEQWSSGVSQYGAFQPVLSTGLDITLPNP